MHQAGGMLPLSHASTWNDLAAPSWFGQLQRVC